MCIEENIGKNISAKNEKYFGVCCMAAKEYIKQSTRLKCMLIL